MRLILFSLQTILLDFFLILTNRDNFPNFKNIVPMDLWSGNISRVPSRINLSLFENTQRILLLKTITVL